MSTSTKNGTIINDNKVELKKKKSTNKFKMAPNGKLPDGQTTTATAIETNAAKAPPAINQTDDNLQAKIYEAFLKLSQFCPSVRFEGIRLISSYFNLFDSAQKKTHNDYILNRLVKGLASNRKCSRLGFSCTLTELFNKHESLEFQAVIDIANKHLKFNLSEQKASKDNKNVLTKEEMRHMQIGLAFVYIAFIQSTRLDVIDESDKDQLSLITTLVTDLNEMRKNKEIKPYIQQIYLQALIILIKKVSNKKVFAKSVYQAIETDLKDNLLLTNFNNAAENSAADILVKNNFNLLLACMNTFPEVMKKQLLKANNIDLIQSLFSTAGHNRIYEFISQSTESLPKIQPFCMELIEFLVTQEPLIAKEIWHLLIDGKLASRREHEKKYLSYKLFLFYLSLVNKSNFKIIFEECIMQSLNIIQSLTLNYLSRWSNLNLICKDVMKELVDLIRLKDAEFVEFDKSCAPIVIKCLSYTRNCHDISDLFNSSLTGLNKFGLEAVYKHLTAEFPEKFNDEEPMESEEPTQMVNGNGHASDNAEKNDQVSNKYMWIINQLFSMSKNDVIFTGEHLLKSVLSYLLVNSYFVQANQSQSTSHPLIKHDRSEKLENHIRDTLLRYVGVLLAKNECSYNASVIGLIRNVQEFIEPKNNKNNLVLSGNLIEKVSEYKTVCVNTINILTKLNTQLEASLKKVSKDNKGTNEATTHCDIIQTFFMVTTFEFFKMFDSFKASKRVICDLKICIEDFLAESSSDTKLKKASKEDDESKPHWIDMLVEMLLNLLTINKAWLRSSVKTQFKKMIPKLTYNSVKLIVDLLEIEAENGFLMEDDEDSDDDGSEIDGSESENEKENGEKAEVNGTKSASEGEESDEDDSEAEMNNMRLDESLNKIISNELDAENENCSDIDDETMLQMDKQLAIAFKLRQSEKKTDNSKIDYKLKVLDLIQELFKTSIRLDLVNNLIKPMLNILFESQKRPNLKSISQRILGFFQGRFKHNLKLIDECNLPKIDEMFETLCFIIECSVTHFNVINTLVECSMFCVKIILFIAETSAEADKTKIIKKLNNTYVEMIKNEKVKINPLMYKQFLIRFPDQSIPLTMQIIDSVNNAESKVFKKTSALITLNQTVNNQMFSKSSEEQAKSFTAKMFSFLELTMDEIMKNENLNLKFVDAFLNLTNRILNLEKNLLDKDFCKSLAAKSTLFVNKEAKMKQTHKSRFTNLIHRCEILSKNTS